MSLLQDVLRSLEEGRNSISFLYPLRTVTAPADFARLAKTKGEPNKSDNHVFR
jgi:hypothetical protein